MGRKKLSADSRKSETIRIRVTEEERKKMEAAAERQEQTLSQWARAVLTAASHRKR